MQGNQEEGNRSLVGSDLAEIAWLRNVSFAFRAVAGGVQGWEPGEPGLFSANA